MENKIETAELVLPCGNFEETLDFFCQKLGFLIIAIFPADDPSVAVISGYGLRIRLERRSQESSSAESIRLRLSCPDPAEIADGKLELISPNGVRIELAASNTPLIVPDLKPSFVISRLSDDAAWRIGRAGMRYRDLIPDRLGGRFIASHIHIPDAGPVPDYVHYHKIMFQIIYCYKGWARLVYQDQGEPFILNHGDCVLQPPGIRHRVLESSANLEVIEVSSPAEHETYADHELVLPNSKFEPDRDFSGQRFRRFIRQQSNWRECSLAGFEGVDTGIGDATGGLGSVAMIRRNLSESDSGLGSHDAEFLFFFILSGKTSLRRGGESVESLVEGDSVVIPAGMLFAFADPSDDLEILQVRLPGKS